MVISLSDGIAAAALVVSVLSATAALAAAKTAREATDLSVIPDMNLMVQEQPSASTSDGSKTFVVTLSNHGKARAKLLRIRTHRESYEVDLWHGATPTLLEHHNNKIMKMYSWVKGEIIDPNTTIELINIRVDGNGMATPDRIWAEITSLPIKVEYEDIKGRRYFAQIPTKR